MRAHNPVIVNSRPQVASSKHLASAVSALGLSTNKQVVSLPKFGLQTRQRLNRMKRVVTGAASQIQHSLQRRNFRYRAAFITVTYRPGQHYEPRDISKLMDHYRGWLRKRKQRLHAVWVMELQKRGAPHYHIVLWLPNGITPPKPDKQGWWKKGSTNCQWAYHPIGYIAKYASKGPGSEDDLPKGARLHGVYGCDVALGWWRAPNWLRQIAGKGMKIIKRPGGWWCIYEMATAMKSPWQLLNISCTEIDIQWVGWGRDDIRSLWELEATGAIKPVTR